MKRTVWKTSCCCWWLLIGLTATSPAPSANWAEASLETIATRVVKLYGAGGVRGIEGYQTGLLVSNKDSDSAGQLVLTVDGVLLESGEAIVVFSNGDRYTGQVVGSDSLTGIAVLRIATEETLRGFDWGDTASATDTVPAPGERVHVLSNAFNIAVGGEPVSLQRGVVAAVVPLPAARRGPPLLAVAPVLLVDCVTSNPGTAGGAVVDLEGRLLGMVGKELKNSETGTWINYALPTPLLREALARAIIPQSQPAQRSREATFSSSLPRLNSYGIHLIPSISVRTPAYVEQVGVGSVAAAAGLRCDDLIVLVEGRSVATTVDAQREILFFLGQEGTARLTVLRGEELIRIELTVRGANE